MRTKFFILTYGFFLFAGCTHPKQAKEGQVTGVLGPQTFVARFKSTELKVGDRVKIFEKKASSGGENIYSEKKTPIGTGTVTAVLRENSLYELKTDSSVQVPVPENAIIQKL